MPWFRMYSEARMDKKLSTLKDDEFRVWFNLLCMSSDNDDQRGTIPYEDIDLLAVEVASGNPDLLSHTLSRLVTLHVCDVTPTSVTFCNFEKRQTRKPSDTPERTAERKRKSRENHPRSRDVTPSHAQSRSVTRIEKIREEEDEDKKRSASHSTEIVNFEDWYIPYPRKENRQDAERAWKRMTTKERELAISLIPRYLPYYNSLEKRFIPYPASWLNDKKWLDEEIPQPNSPNGRTHVTQRDNIMSEEEWNATGGGGWKEISDAQRAKREAERAGKPMGEMEARIRNAAR